MGQSNGRVLCVEDDPDTAAMLDILLSQAGCDVALALTASDGLAMAKRGGFDLILLDWYFPDGTGMDLCRSIRRFDNLTPILFYTGEAHVAQIEEAMGAGAQGYLVKPVEIDDLLRAVSEYAPCGYIN